MRQATRILFVLGVTACSIAFADTAAPPRTVSVSGTMVTRVAPDLINWSLTQSEHDVNLAAAKERSDGKMKALLTTIKELGVAPEDTQTGALRIERTYANSLAGNSVFKDWLVQRSITIKQRDTARFDEYFAKLISAADVELSYTFENSKYHELREETRLKAVNLAREKAQAMCERLGVHCGAPMSISEAPAPLFMPASGPWGATNAMGGASNGSIGLTSPSGTPDGVSETFASGQIEIRESVNITFAIE